MSGEVPFGRVNLRSAYDALAASYDANRGQFAMDEVLRDLMAGLPTEGDLLDLGCGAGEPVAVSFIQRGWRVTGVDSSPAMLSLAARYCPQMARIEGDMLDVALPAAAFDAVTAIYSLFHCPWTEHPLLFSRIRRWLRPGARLLFTYATREYTGADRFNGYKRFMGQSLFYSHTTPDALLGQLRDAGLSLEQAVRREIGGETFLWVTARRPLIRQSQIE